MGGLRRIPDYCVERVQALRREYGWNEFICYFNQGGIMDHAMVRQSMTSFAREVNAALPLASAPSCTAGA